MNLTPTSQAIFQSFFIQKSKLQSSNHTQYKSTLSNKLGCSKIKQFHERPSSTMIQQIGSVDLSQIGLDRTRKISLNESQLTVRGIRRPFKISSSIEQTQQVPQISQYQKRKTRWIQITDRQSSPFTRINSPEQEKEIKNIKRLKLQLLSRDSKYPKFQLNLLKNKLQNQDGVCEYFNDKHFHKQKNIPELSDQIRIIITREQQTLEPLDMCRIEKFRNYH
ncbi:unnamed protein product (macronuclear) [Paramecium tetraurelia]|uniref:Uncharacterized protein n=1 Tax=Paramecium tetraurelia TaxID=5888 RepID=A0E7R7_PARTE|nr:uncharacterized protein GSPATT00024062001 [Paramecium tetraurelia]CAK91334.1 unnamed protein product [Paramecium tetraurelia]|eukprot:XP_001458731.1 hypothetical protein (macronuclear) [Paramecium tetraurelia strain d4-2]